MHGILKRGDRRLLSLRNVVLNAPQRMDGVQLLSELPYQIATFFNLDPQYRAVLDKMAYGNEGARQKERALLPQMSDDQIAFFAEEAQRVLKPGTHLVMWMDKFTLLEGIHRARWLRRCRDLVQVDAVFWNKVRFGNGYRTRSQTEIVVILQKVPTRAKGIWKDHAMSDSWTELADGALHPHCKPIILTSKLIRAVTEPGDLVVDPCAGGYGVLEACKASGRNFVGCDIMG